MNRTYDTTGMIKALNLHGQYWDLEEWWHYRERLFRLVLHTDSFYPQQAWARCEMMTPNGWTTISAFNPADFGENHSQYKAAVFDACRQHAEDAAGIAADTLGR